MEQKTQSPTIDEKKDASKPNTKKDIPKLPPTKIKEKGKIDKHNKKTINKEIDLEQISELEFSSFGDSTSESDSSDPDVTEIVPPVTEKKSKS